MAIVIPPPHAYVMTKDTIYNRGVFAGRDFKEGELVEVCPILEFALSDKVKEFPRKIEKAVFKWRLLTGNSAVDKYCLVLGFAGAYKDTQEGFNLVCKSDEARAVIGFFALRDISKNEELLIDSRWRAKASQMITSSIGETTLNL